MKDIAIYGAGGLGREVAAMLEYMTWNNPEGWNFLGFFDDGKKAGDEIDGLGRVLGGINDLNKINRPLSVALCFGDPATTSLIFSKITNPLISFPNLICIDFFVSNRKTLKLGQGNVILGSCISTVGVSLGNFNLLNGSVTLGHDVNIGDYNVFMPGCRISGEVSIGNECLFGAGCFVKQQLTIPDRVTLSPLSPLLTKPKPDSLYIGNPAKRFKF